MYVQIMPSPSDYVILVGSGPTPACVGNHPTYYRVKSTLSRQGWSLILWMMLDVDVRALVAICRDLLTEGYIIVIEQHSWAMFMDYLSLHTP